MTFPRQFVRQARFLVVDEPITVTYRRQDRTFRLRIWRAKDSPAVVLVSQVKDGPEPAFWTTKLINMVSQAYLSCSSDFSFWQSELPGSCDDGKIEVVFFEEFGLFGRRWLDRPIERPKHWSDLSDLIGSDVTA